MIRVFHLLNNSGQDQCMNSLKAKNKVNKIRQHHIGSGDKPSSWAYET